VSKLRLVRDHLADEAKRYRYNLRDGTRKNYDEEDSGQGNISSEKNNQWHFLVLIRYRYLAHKPGVKKIDVKFAIIYILIQRLK
jgi:hypothetical protein